jgi:hypothetical protein
VSTRLSSCAQLLVRLFTLVLRLYPDGVQREYAAEMQAVFCLKVADAAHCGAWTLIILACREALDLPSAIASAHFHAVGGRMQPYFPSTSDQTPWTAALLSLLPFIIAGPLRIILSYQPGWMPRQSSLFYLLFLLFSSLVVTAGLAIGVVKKFPRWAYPYAIYLAFSLYLLAGYALYLFHWNIYQNNFFLFLAAILFVLWLPGFRSFYRHIPQDWTLLSYGLYGLVLYLLASLDYDETPRLNLLVLLPSLLALCSALAHLRIRSAPVRIAALLAGTFAGLFFWLIPIFQGMVSVWIGIIIGMFMLMAYGIILAAILLAPMLLMPAIHSWRAWRASRI